MEDIQLTSPPRTPQKTQSSSSSSSSFLMSPPRSPSQNTHGFLNSFHSPLRENESAKSPFKDSNQLKKFIQSGESPFLESRKSPSKYHDIAPTKFESHSNEIEFKLNSFLDISPSNRKRKNLERKPLSDCTNHLIKSSPLKKRIFEKTSNETENILSPTLGLTPKKTPQITIPQFYFPFGNPKNSLKNKEILEQVRPFFANGFIKEGELTPICKKIQLPLYLSCAIFAKIDVEGKGTITFEQFSEFWLKLTSQYHDEESRVFNILLQGDSQVLTPSDFEPVVNDVVWNHPGLEFLTNTPTFQDKYIQTVLIQIFYQVGDPWKSEVTLKQFKNIKFVEALKDLEKHNDINLVRNFFSYKNFYVLYCKFWELDTNRDGYIQLRDLIHYEGGSLSKLILHRILNGIPKPLTSGKKKSLNFEDFCWFLISEEDKTSRTAIEYWFRCLDFDNDGVLSMFEMEFFYDHQVRKLEALKFETMAFEDFLCSLLDLVHPAQNNLVTMADIKKSKRATLFFNSLFNVNKYLAYESRHNSVIRAELKRAHLTDWEKFVQDEYAWMESEENKQNSDGSDDEDQQTWKKSKKKKLKRTKSEPIIKTNDCMNDTDFEDDSDSSPNETGNENDSESESENENENENENNEDDNEMEMD